MPWLHEAVVRLGPAFPSPRFIPVGSITDPVAGNCVQQVLVEYVVGRWVLPSPQGDHRLEGLQRLDRPVRRAASEKNASGNRLRAWQYAPVCAEHGF